ncbi:MAG: signal peptidase II [Deltaproteobacteria bacterium RIFOXYD12_FULL_50_9]|nr:MAG: signal peptidase II [Deltaproteobacteria bacterium RIFOXYD12_FULL_50_9]
MLKRYPVVALLFCAVMVVVLDQLTKLWVMATFGLFESKTIISGFFSLTYVTNSGAAFGFLAGDYGAWRHIFFVAVAIGALVLIGFTYRHFRDRLLCVVALGLIGGGALGNLIDRFRLGSVVDFLDFYVSGWHWPAFNVADSAITTGVGLFLLENYLNERKMLAENINERQQDHEK